jgi:alpha-1,3-glucosyltransferase
MDVWIIFWVTSFLKLLLLPLYRSTDFEVHRNWLAITYSLPVRQWYFEATSEWTLDYPPFFAWFEFGLSLFAPLFDGDMLEVRNLMYASAETILFQRLTVIATDLLLFLAICHFVARPAPFPGEKAGDASSVKRQWILTLLVFSNPGLMLVDHVHFQYNGVLLGLFIFSISFIQRGQDLKGAVLFAVLLCSKHIFVYAAPVYFVYLLRHYCCDEDPDQQNFKGWEQFKQRPNKPARIFSLARFALLGSFVVAVFAVAFGPFVYWGQLSQLLGRLFPFDKRGLTHSYWAPNCWVFYNLSDKVLSRVLRREGVARMTGGLVEDAGFSVLKGITPSMTLGLVVLAMLPALVRLWVRPHARLFLPTLLYCLMCSFMLGWHVHEKAILMVTVPLGLCALDCLHSTRLSLFMTAVGTFSLFPLLHEPTEAPVKLLLLALHSGLSWVLLSSVWSQRQGKRRITFDGLLGAGHLTLGYLAVALPVQLFVSVVQPLLLPGLPFLPLIIMSVYCAIANLAAWSLCFQRTTRIATQLDDD